MSDRVRGCRRLATAILLAAGLWTLASAPSAAQEFNGEDGPIRVVTVVGGLEHPWGLAFLPDGRMLVTERPGRLRIVAADGKLSAPVKGVPEVYAVGQGGLLDVVLDPKFADNGLIYWSYAEPEGGVAGTAVARGRLVEDGGGPARLQDVQVIFRQQPKVSGPNHWGSRLVFAPDGTLFVTLGERFQRDRAQKLDEDLGKLVRINADGSIPKDNPFVGRPDARPEILVARSSQRTGARRSTRRRSGCGRSSTARRAVTRSTSPKPARITAGRSLPTVAITPARRSARVPPSPASSSPSTIGIRRSRLPVWRSTPQIGSRRGAATCSWGR